MCRSPGRSMNEPKCIHAGLVCQLPSTHCGSARVPVCLIVTLHLNVLKKNGFLPTGSHAYERTKIPTTDLAIDLLALLQWTPPEAKAFGVRAWAERKRRTDAGATVTKRC